MAREVKQSVVVKNTLYEVMNSCFPDHERGAATRILVLLAFNEIGLEQGILTLKNLNNSNMYTRIFAEEGYFGLNHLNRLIELSGNDDWSHLLDNSGNIEDEFDQLFIPVASFSLISDLLHFSDYRPLARIVQRAMLKGKKITMVEDAANPYSAIIREANLDKGTSLLRTELFAQLKKVQGFGVTLIHSGQVKSHFQMQSVAKHKKLLSEDVVLSASRNKQQEIVVSKGTLVTPLARDTAKDLGIRLTIK
jgi:hypothetical protein